MKASLEWLSDYVTINKTPEEIAERLTMSSIEVNTIARGEQSYDHIVVGEVVGCDRHPNADRLKVCAVDVGRQQLQIVCGAPNVRKGLKVPVALVGAVLQPDPERPPMKIQKVNLRNVESHGMICSEAELGLSDEASGIMELDAKTKVGTPFAHVVEGSDVVFDLDVLANRGDCMGHKGIARELSALFATPFTEKGYTLPKPNNNLHLRVDIDQRVCVRYAGLVISGVSYLQSPDWLKKRLQMVGERPIDAVVDVTNYLMHDLGQPYHAFDYDTIEGHHMNVRQAKKGEVIATLDGVERKLLAGMAIIEDKKRIIDLAGIKGGAVSSFTLHTKTLFLEAAVFDPMSIRTTSRRLGLRTEAVGRFEKGVDSEGVMDALAKAYTLLKEMMPDIRLEAVVDVYPDKKKKTTVHFDPHKTVALTGVNIKPTAAKKALVSLGCIITDKKSSWDVAVPSWRSDIRLQEDVVEEIIRIAGYEHIPATLPTVSVAAPSLPKPLYWQRRLKDFLTAQGAVETLNYSFHSPDHARLAGLSEDDHARVTNPLSDEQRLLRTQLLSGILKTIQTNAASADAKIFFELGRVFFNQKKIVAEKSLLTVCYVGTGQKGFYRMKGIAESIFDLMHIDGATITQLKKQDGDACNYWNMFDKEKAALFSYQGKPVGVVGSVAKDVLARFGIERSVAFTTLYIDTIVDYASRIRFYKDYSKYPTITLDVAAIIPKDVVWSDVRSAILDIKNNLITDIALFDVYEGNNVPKCKRSLAFRLIFQAWDRTLRLEEAEEVLRHVWAVLEQKFGAEIRR